MTCYQQGVFPFTYAAQIAHYAQIKQLYFRIGH